MSKGTMLILKGINNLLHEQPALDYAAREGFDGEVLDASGETGARSAQVNAAIQRIGQGDVTALYGFSGGGYNTVHIFDRLSQPHALGIDLVVVLGSPGVQRSSFPSWVKTIIYNDPAVAHMDQPDNFLALTAGLSGDDIGTGNVS